MPTVDIQADYILFAWARLPWDTVWKPAWYLPEGTFFFFLSP